MSKNVLTKYPLIANGNMTGNLTSAAVWEMWQDNLGIQVTWTGTPVGVLAVNGSVDGVTFYPLTFNPALTQPAGSAGGYLINVNQFPFQFMTFTYTATSGTGTLNALLSSKEI